MEQDIYALPEVEITEAEDRIFTAAERLLDYLHLYGAKLSREGMVRHLTYLGVTEAQIPALMDAAERKKLIIGHSEPETDPLDSVRLRAIGRVMLVRCEESSIPLREKERLLLQLRFGLTDGIPRSVVETAEALEVSEERVLELEKRLVRRATHAYRRRRIRDFYT